MGIADGRRLQHYEIVEPSALAASVFVGSIKRLYRKKTSPGRPPVT
jgi:hypothetical protein